MSRVFTANVFITKSRIAIEQLFFSNTKVSSFTSAVSKLSPKELNDSFIASPNSNEGLERFEYSFGMNKGNDPSKVVLSFVETSKLIEFLLLDDEPGAIRIKTELDTLRHLQEYERLNLISSQATLSETGNFSFLGESDSLDDMFADLKKSNTYYFAFGVGDDIKNWDGPHVMNLAAATLSNDDANVRKVSATFVANINSLKVWDGTFEKEMGYGGTLKKFSQVYSAKSFHRAEAIESLPMKTTYAEGEKVVAHHPGGSSQGFLLNADKPIRSLLKNYIGAVTSRPGNAVVAFEHEMGELIAYQPNALKGDSTKILDVPSNQKLLQLGINYQIDDNINSKAPVKPLTPSLSPVESSTEANSLEPSFREQAQEIRSAWREFLNDVDASERYSYLVNAVRYDVQGNYDPPPVPLASTLTLPQSQFYALVVGELNAYFKGEGSVDPKIVPFINVETGDVAPEYSEATRRAFDSLMSDGKPEGMNEDGSGNTEEYTEEKKKEAAKSLAPTPDNLGYLREDKPVNQQSSLDATMEQPSLSQEKAESTPSITLNMNVTNPYSDGKVSGFSPLLSPLSRFAAGLRDEPGFGFKFVADPKSVEFDFYEETDLKVLNLWKKYKIISDSNSSAFVFGDIRRIRNCLYLNDYMPSNSMKRKGDGTNLKIWKTLSEGNYQEYRSEFADLFQLKVSSRVSSFESNDTIPEESLAMQLAKSQKFDFTKSDLLLKHNIENPNVVSLKYSTKKYISSLHNMLIRPEIDKQIIGTTRIASTERVANKLMGREEIRKLLDSTGAETDAEYRVALETNPQVKNQLSKTLADLIVSNKFPELAKVQIYDIVSLLLTTKRMDTLKESAKAEYKIISPVQRLTNVRKDVMDRYIQQVVEVKAKTLPFFNHKLFIGKSCGLLGMTGGVIGSDSDIRHLAPYAGNYNVHGWKHVISSSEISTSLFLIRDGFESTGTEGKSTLAYVKEGLESMVVEIESKYSGFSNVKPSRENAAKAQREAEAIKSQKRIEELNKKEGISNMVGAKLEKYVSYIDQGISETVDYVSHESNKLYNKLALVYEFGDGRTDINFNNVDPFYLLSPRAKQKRLNGDDKEIAALRKLIDQIQE